MTRFLVVFLAVVLAPHAQAQCRLCGPVEPSAEPDPARRLDIVVETALDFSRAAQTGGGGSIAVDPISGRQLVTGLVHLGGIPVQGRVRISGEPLRAVRIELPVQVELSSPSGASARLVDLSDDLSVEPALDMAGNLVFSFGGRLIVAPGVTGMLRGRVPITVNYR